MGELKAVARNCRGRRWRPLVFELGEKLREDERKQNSLTPEFRMGCVCVCVKSREVKSYSMGQVEV